MSDARTRILANIRAARRSEAVAVPEAAGGSNLIPQRALVTGSEAVEAFRTRMIKNAGTVEIVASRLDVPGEVISYLDQLALHGPIRLAPEPSIRAMPWVSAFAREIRIGTATADDAVGVTLALAGIAETGTLMVRSGPVTPTCLNFLPETHIVILPCARIVGSLEGGWDSLRRDTNGRMPRTVNLISGPSRTADIAMTMIMGAHGPKRLHVILVEEDGWAETTGNRG